MANKPEIIERPDSPASRVLQAMKQAALTHPEYDESVKIIIMATEELDDQVVGGLITLGFKTLKEVMAAMLSHTEGVCEAQGVQFKVVIPGHN